MRIEEAFGCRISSGRGSNEIVPISSRGVNEHTGRVRGRQCISGVNHQKVIPVGNERVAYVMEAMPKAPGMNRVYERAVRLITLTLTYHHCITNNPSAASKKIKRWATLIDPWKAADPRAAKSSLTENAARKVRCEYKRWYPMVILCEFTGQRLNSQSWKRLPLAHPKSASCHKINDNASVGQETKLGGL